MSAAASRSSLEAARSNRRRMRTKTAGEQEEQRTTLLFRNCRRWPEPKSGQPCISSPFVGVPARAPQMSSSSEHDDADDEPPKTAFAMMRQRGSRIKNRSHLSSLATPGLAEPRRQPVDRVSVSCEGDGPTMLQIVMTLSDTSQTVGMLLAEVSRRQGKNYKSLYLDGPFGIHYDNLPLLYEKDMVCDVVGRDDHLVAVFAKRQPTRRLSREMRRRRRTASGTRAASSSRKRPRVEASESARECGHHAQRDESLPHVLESARERRPHDKRLESLSHALGASVKQQYPVKREQAQRKLEEDAVASRKQALRDRLSRVVRPERHDAYHGVHNANVAGCDASPRPTAVKSAPHQPPKCVVAPRADAQWFHDASTQSASSSARPVPALPQQMDRVYNASRPAAAPPPPQMERVYSTFRHAGATTTHTTNRPQHDHNEKLVQPSDRYKTARDRVDALWKEGRPMSAPKVDLFDAHGYPTAALKARMAHAGEVPAYDTRACGTVAEWNSLDNIVNWGKKGTRWFAESPDAAVDVNEAIAFFYKRKGPQGHPVSELLGRPESKENGWFRVPWKAFDESALPVACIHEDAVEPGKADWQRAWHGTKFEALYSIMYHGGLMASDSSRKGARFKDTSPGVYLHKDFTKHKAENYMRFVPLCQNNVFWAAKWEVRVDRSDRVMVSKPTDQWVQKERSIRFELSNKYHQISGILEKKISQRNPN